MTASDFLYRLPLIAFSLVGLYSCLSFGSEFLGKYIKPLAKFKPIELVCNDGTCIKLEHTRWAHVFGVPNWWFGTVFYFLTLLAALWTNVWVVSFAIMGSIGAICLSVVLIYGLAIKLKTVCHLCYVAHAANLGIFIVWLIAIFQATKPA